MKTINWKCSKEEYTLINEVVNRAMKLYQGITDEMGLNMDIIAAHLNGTPLDFNKLLSFDDFNFGHDIIGIMNNINRNTGELDNCFLPRCSK